MAASFASVLWYQQTLRPVLPIVQEIHLLERQMEIMADKDKVWTKELKKIVGKNKKITQEEWDRIKKINFFMQKIRMVDGTVDTSLRNLGYDYPHELDQLKNIIILNNDLSPINNRVTIDFQNVSWQDVLNFTFLGGGLKNETVIMGAVINSPTQDEDYIYRFEYRIDEKTAQKIIDVYKPKK